MAMPEASVELKSNLPGISDWPPDPAFTAKPELDILVELPGGKTRYSLEGDSGPLIVCLHSVFFNKDEFDNISSLLLQSGFRVLRYDQWGRGYSDFPGGKECTWDLFCNQLLDLLSHLAIQEPVHLLGFALGGALAPLFATRFPDVVEKVILVSPAPPKTKRKTSVNDTMVNMMIKKLSQCVASLYFSDFRWEEAVQAKKFIEFQTRLENREGLKVVLRADLNHMLSQEQDTLDILGRSKEVLILWGTKDTVCAYQSMAKFRDLIPRAVCLGVTGAAHSDVLAVHSNIAAQEIALFLKASSSEAYRRDVEARRPAKLERPLAAAELT